MKHSFSKIFIIETVILIPALVALCITAFSYRRHHLDIVALNDYVQTVKAHWEEPQVLGRFLPDADLMLLSADGDVIYSSDEKLFEGIGSQLDAVSQGMFCITVTDEDIFLGTLVIADPASEDYENIMTRILCITGLIVFIIMISVVLFYWYVYRNVTVPFERMKEFASRVAQGDLDEPLLMEKNNMFGLFTESFDMMREQLRAARERETELKRKEKELVASLSHDLRSPVTGIALICELLEVKVEDAYVLGKIKNIRHKTEEMNVLLSDLLSSALDELGELNVSLSEVTSDILGRLVEDHDTKKKVVSGEIPGCILKVDQNRISQVIGNIIGNSYKYADTKIEVSYMFFNDYLQMTIHDYGEGVDPEELSLLTNKFYRGKKHAAGKEGSGLGLFIASELMEKMHGQLVLSSDQGFTVTLFIPLA